MARDKLRPEDAELQELKLEVATELGLADKIASQGWSALSAAEAGRIGGRMAKILREGKGFPAAKIGSAFMATPAGQPAIRDTARFKANARRSRPGGRRRPALKQPDAHS